MRVLVACECSGVVRNAFRELGHDAWSCDLQAADDGSEFHIQTDCRRVLRENWDLMIAHPPCTYLAASGINWTTRGFRAPELTEGALKFVQELMDAPIARICIENPVGVISTRIRKPDQNVQPWQFGDNASKRTALWLKNLPLLVSTSATVVPPSLYWLIDARVDYTKHKCREIDGYTFCTELKPMPAPRWANQTASGNIHIGPRPDRAKIKSVTFPGIARAMAEQWGCLATKKF